MSLKAAYRNARRALNYGLIGQVDSLPPRETLAEMLHRGELIGRERFGLDVTVENGVVTKIRKLETPRKEEDSQPEKADGAQESRTP